MPLLTAGANRPGTHALYLALEPVTAIREYQQTSTLLPPGTLVSYTVQLSKVVDFRPHLRMRAARRSVSA